MFEKSLKKRLALILAAAMILVVFPLSAFAETALDGHGVEGLDVMYDEGVWSASNGSIEGAVSTEVGSSSCGNGESYTAVTATLTLTNGLTTAAVIGFEADDELDGGSVAIDGMERAAGRFQKMLAAGESMTVVIVSTGKENGTTKIWLTDITLVPDAEVSVTFTPSEHGSFTVDGAAVTEETVVTKNITESFALDATAESGYEFVCWEDEAGFFGLGDPLSYYFTEAHTVTAVFAPVSQTVFKVGRQLFNGLDEAMLYAVSEGEDTVVLISSGVLPAGDYTIPAGKTLLVPFSDLHSVYTTEPEVRYESHVGPSAYKILTMASGANITVEDGGAISVPSMLCAHGQNSSSWNGTPTKKHGRINMQDGSAITLESGGALYCYGYISGSGTVTAESGSVVWEALQFRCWRGGNASTSDVFPNYRVFPMSQYYVQNIEVPLTLESGAQEWVYTAVNASSDYFCASSIFIGEGGMFVPGEGASITKSYDGTTDRLIVDIDGDLMIGTLSLTIPNLPIVGTMNLDTMSYVLPINNNITVNINSGTTSVAPDQDVAFLPGSVLTVAEGAVILAQSNVFVYDHDEWGQYGAGSAQFVPVGYSTVNGSTRIRTNDDLVDAVVDVNGTMNITGALYTTEGGAGITSSGKTGVVIMQAGDEVETFQATQSGTEMTPVSIPITPAQLLNGDGTYTETAEAESGTAYYYSSSSDRWVTGPVYTVTWKNWDGSVLETDKNVESGADPIYNGETPERPSDGDYDYFFTGWSPEVDTVTEDATYTAVFLKVMNCTNGKATVDSVVRGENGVAELAVSSDSDAACAVGVLNADGTVTALSCTTTEGVHTFTADPSAVIVIVLKGDVDLNGVVRGKDSTMLKRYLAGTAELSAIQIFAGDNDGNGVISGRETTMLARAVAGSYTYTW